MGYFFKLALAFSLIWTAPQIFAADSARQHDSRSPNQQHDELLQRIATIEQSNRRLRLAIGRQERQIQRQQQELKRSHQLLESLDSYSDQIQQSIDKARNNPYRQSSVLVVPGFQLDSPTPSVRFLASLKLLREEYENSIRLTTWSGQLNSGQQVEFVKLGRIALYALSPDLEEGAIYLPDKEQWQSLTPSEISELVRARKIALKEEPSDWLYLPLPRQPERGTR